jgi:hypothetical protein
LAIFPGHVSVRQAVFINAGARVYIPRSITAVLDERLLFNFRVAPGKLASLLPVPWLKPLEINGTCVVSFCILHLKNVTIAPLPGSIIGWKTISCAYRCGVVDTSSGTDVPAVWIIDRLADLPVIARLSPILLADTLPIIRPHIKHSGEHIDVEIDFPDCQKLFKARVVRNPAQVFRSKTFGDMRAFSAFIHNGVTSYAASIFGDALTKIDLIKEDPVYEPVAAEVDFSWLESTWANAGLEFDSAVRAHAGNYRWKYRGLVPLVSGPERFLAELTLPRSASDI